MKPEKAKGYPKRYKKFKHELEEVIFNGASSLVAHRHYDKDIRPSDVCYISIGSVDKYNYPIIIRKGRVRRMIDIISYVWTGKRGKLRFT